MGDLRCNSHNHGGTAARLFASTTTDNKEHERLLIVGSGVAGCSAALVAARHGIRSTVLHAGSSRDDCNSYWAQGGIIYKNYQLREKLGEGAAKGDVEDDSWDSGSLVDTAHSLVNDVRAASGYVGPLQRNSDLDEGPFLREHLLNGGDSSSSSGRNAGVNWNEDAAWKLAVEGPERVRQLLLGSADGGCDDFGASVPFDRDGGTGTNEEGELSLCLEASHAAPRIIHYADCTGKAITTHITAAAAAHPLIDFASDAVVTDLILDDNGGGDDGPLVLGARVLDRRTGIEADRYATRGVVLASGGLAGIYQHSTNPQGFNALGSSVALALRASEQTSSSSTSTSSPCSDLEYVQFHPTSLFIPNEARFLLTEALRGEGAILRDADGRAFAKEYHPDAELAPRDVVARAVFNETQKSNSSDRHNAFLDITHRDAAWLKRRFPTVDSHLQSKGFDFSRDVVPVVPAAHYTCGGVTTDLDGRVGGYRNLYAAGEAARTGLHGGNRLASTSLLEGLVFGASAADCAAGRGGSDADVDDLNSGEAVREAADRARGAIEERIATKQDSSQASSSYSSDDELVRTASAEVLARLKSIMWDGVGVVRTPSGLAAAASELRDIRDEADALRERSPGCWEAVALRDAATAGTAVAEAALANRVSGGAHCIVNDMEEDEHVGVKAASTSSSSPSSSDDEDSGSDADSEDEEEDVVLMAAR